MPEQEKIRLQKYLAQHGVASRRKAEEMIQSGRVHVDGRPAFLGQSVLSKTALVTVDGQRLQQRREELVYLMLHKPRGFVTTMEDPHAKRSVAQLVETCPQRVFPVGRLDKESEGLLLLTNDGAFANALSHPSQHVEKLYRVTLRGQVSEEQQTKLSGGGMFLDGRPAAPLQLRVLAAEADRTVLEFTLREGRNRQIRRMCEQLGLEVLRLKRTAVASLRLGMLPQGQWRALTPEELRRLKQKIAKKEVRE
ncbi:MAG: rRNA pseudouridine synthase [Oscillospiraceae bacterium]|jgi:23S rRNA pseudouridine2605 synthase|nr:rRNA pseudouridine synthase [Oscillospiraceae bacterium]